MDGFIAQAEKGRKGCADLTNPNCSNTTTPDVMGYHDAREIPNYLAYAKNFVLQDHIFEPNASWSLPSHLFMVSAWSAKCTQPAQPESCSNALDAPNKSKGVTKNDYAWTDLTYLLYKNKVSWAYYLDHVMPPQVDENGYGLRVPGLVISPYARQNLIDHQALSFDAYLKFIEDDFLGGSSLDPKTDGRPDPRPTVRENVSILGNLANDFDFSRPPRQALLLPLHPAPGPASIP